MVTHVEYEVEEPVDENVTLHPQDAAVLLATDCVCSAAE